MVATPVRQQGQTPSPAAGAVDTPKTGARPSLLRKLDNKGKVEVVRGLQQRATANGVSLSQQGTSDGFRSGTLSKLVNKVTSLEENPDKKSLHTGKLSAVTKNMDAAVKEFIADRRSKYQAVHKSHVVSHICQIAMGFMTTTEADTFYRSQRERLGLRELRRTEKKPVILHEDVDALGVFCDVLAKTEHTLLAAGVPQVEVFTCDETPINAEAAATKTMVLPSESGKHGTRIVENGDGKERVTLTVCVSQLRLLPPQIIFKGVPGHQITQELNDISSSVKSGVLLCVQENAYQDSELYTMCVERWMSMMGKGCIFTHDNAGVHLAQATADAFVRRGVKEVRGPQNCTLYWQAADLGINAWIQKRFAELLSNEEPKPGRMSRLRTVELILEAYYALPLPMVAACIDNMKRSHEKVLEMQSRGDAEESEASDAELETQAEITSGIVLTQPKASERKAAQKIATQEKKKIDREEKKKVQEKKKATDAEALTTTKAPPTKKAPRTTAGAKKTAPAPAPAQKKAGPLSHEDLTVGMVVYFQAVGAAADEWTKGNVTKIGGVWISIQPMRGGRQVCAKPETLRSVDLEDVWEL